jgi:ABC-type phosphate/phosphonate transport system substrate-binding protein
MTRRPLFAFALFVMALGIASPMPVAAQPSKDSSTIEIGLVKQFFNDVPDVMIKIATEPFGDLMKDVTGFQGKLCYKSDAFEVARKLDKGEFQIGVFHGHEFAWLQKAYPKLRPLMLAVNQYSEVKAYVIVNKTNEATDLKALRGKSIDLPLLTKEHCHLFLEKACTDNAQQGSKAYFKTIQRSKNPIKAIDDVVAGKSDAVLIDTLTMEIYKADKGPVFEKFCRVLVASQPFPPPVIAYKEGALADATLQKFRAGLTDAHNNTNGADILRMWQIDRFMPIPESYSKSLADTLQRYPAPAQ